MLALLNAIGVEPESYKFLGLFGSKIEAAMIAILMACIPVLAAMAYFIRRRARLPEAAYKQRRADDQWRKDMKADLDRELQEFKQKFDTVEGLTRNNTARIEDVAKLAEAAATKAEELDGKVEEVKDYLHEVSHGLRGEMNKLTVAVSRELREMSQSVGEVTGSVRTLISTLRGQ